MTSGAGDSDNSTGQAPRPALQPDPDVISRRIDAGTVLINLRTNKIYELNATGSRIWELLKDGRTVAEMQAALEQVEKKSGKDPLEIFVVALNNIKPMVEVKSRRVGGANYQVPVEVRPVRRMALAMRWLKDSARKRGEKSMSARLANELLEASEGRGGAMKKRDEVHRMAEANKAFSHFRF